MKEELKSMEHNNVCNLVEFPEVAREFVVSG